MVGAVESASLEDDWHGVNETASLSRALGARSYGLFIEPLLPLESRAAAAALIFVNGQSLTSQKGRPFWLGRPVCSPCVSTHRLRVLTRYNLAF